MFASASPSRAMRAVSNPSLFALSMRSFLTEAQAKTHGDTIASLPTRVQQFRECEANSIRFLSNIFPKRIVQPVPFTKNFSDIDELLRTRGMLVFVGNGITQEETDLTSKSRYVGMHAVVIVKSFWENGTPYFLIFDGDDTLNNAEMTRLRSFANAQDTPVNGLTPDEIQALGSTHALYRVVEALPFLKEASQTFFVDNSDSIPSVTVKDHYVRSDSPPYDDAISGFFNWAKETVFSGWYGGLTSQAPAEAPPAVQGPESSPAAAQPVPTGATPGAVQKSDASAQHDDIWKRFTPAASPQRPGGARLML